MQITAQMLRAIAGSRAKQQNIDSIITAFAKYADKIGLNLPHRAAQFLAQIMHETAGLKYNAEIWGNTPAQKRYDTRTDLGNTPAQDGDGKLYKGRGLIMLTGKKNYASFSQWCQNMGINAPDFVKKPQEVENSPWSTIAAFWYWTANALNKYADIGDIEMITRTINGGLNGYQDRLQWYDKCSLVLLGYQNTDIAAFQKSAGLKVDGISGAKTRAAMHKQLLALADKTTLPSTIANAPVLDVKVPEKLDKPLHKTSGFWERVGGIFGGISLGGAGLFGDWRVIVAITIALVILLAIGLRNWDKILKAVKDLKALS